MNKYVLSSKDIDTHFFHFTEEKNLSAIEENGLIPCIGGHAKYIEKSKKVFFVEGLDNLLILFDCWINIYFYMPKIPFIYTLGSYFLRKKWFPMIIADGYFGTLKMSKIHRKRAFKVFDKLLDSGILLQLDLKENIDFKYDDQDEIKLWGYQKRHLELMGYSPKYSSLERASMDRWNMHTMTGHGVDSKNIQLCVLKNGKYNLRDIFEYCINNTQIDIKNVCPVLYDYLSYKKKDLIDSKC